MCYTPQFHAEEQTPAQRWETVRWAICIGASDRAVPSQKMARLQLRYIAGEIDQVQVHDELMRWYRPDIAPGAGVRPLPPAAARAARPGVSLRGGNGRPDGGNE